MRLKLFLFAETLNLEQSNFSEYEMKGKNTSFTVLKAKEVQKASGNHGFSLCRGPRSVAASGELMASHSCPKLASFLPAFTLLSCRWCSGSCIGMKPCSLQGLSTAEEGFCERGWWWALARSGALGPLARSSWHRSGGARSQKPNRFFWSCFLGKLPRLLY